MIRCDIKTHKIKESLNKYSAGASGKASFNIDDLKDDKAFFAVARNAHQEAIGCGAVRAMDAHTGEVKRVYAKEKGKGVGTLILRFLEEESRKLDYHTLRLETRRINERAVQFYFSQGYKEIPNYGHYQNRPEAICFEKSL